MDIQLPDIDGVEALGRLRADGRTASLPVLALTAQAMEGDRERFLAAGFDGYLSKPVNVADLVATVARYCEGWHSMSDAQARILVVDDVPENVRLLEAVLQAHGYDVVTATDGQAALDLASSAKPDLVLLDVMMPPPDGLAVCKRLREMEETAILPVIMLTASEGSEKTTAIEAGADDFLSKPFNRDELLTRIRSLLRIKRYHDTIKSQAAELRDLNRTLEERVQSSSRSWDDCSGYVGSFRPSSRTRSSPRATIRSCEATVGRSRCSSPTCAAGRPSSTPWSPRS